MVEQHLAGHYNQHGAYVEGFYAENIPSVVGSLRTDSTVASFCLGMTNRLLHCKPCPIYVVRFLDGTMRVMCIRVHINHLLPEFVAKYVETELSIFNRNKRGY